VLNYFGYDEAIFPKIQDVFSNHGTVTKKIADELGLKEGIPVAYKAGDQPNNALALNVLNAGEVAATAGTSGVIYGVDDQLVYDN
ncbi:carbohydrate kinase, partial [Pseudomonas sp. GW460-C3]